MTEETLFIEALEIADPAERAAFLDRACAGNPDLRSRLDRLLARHGEAGGILDRPAPLPPTGPPDAPGGETDDGPPPARPGGGVVGPYKLVEVIGEGGMGTVWLAQQQEPVKRLVALKVIKAGMDSRQVVARFEAERQALALMSHPNIATVLDGGVTPDGRPYFVMELVKGVPITRFCDERRLTPRERLELFVPVCQAVQHAHQKGVIHRDLKPSNVLVALYDGRPVPKVIDFGVAKATGQPLTEKTLVTGLGAVVGTPEYMSPEQAELNQLDVDTRSDVYSLGVLLYELLTGTTPIERKRFKEAALLEILRLVREEEPLRPSTRLSATDELPTIAANRGVEPKKLTGLVRGELDWIVMKALEKDRDRRYETANGFAADVLRYLADEPVLACPPSAAYRLRKFARRNRTVLAAAAAAGLLLLGAGGLGWYADRQAAQRRSEAEAREREDQARLGRNTEAVMSLLDQCEDALKVDRADRAAIALEAAERRAAEGGAEELAGRLARDRAELALLRALNETDTFRWTWTGLGYPAPGAVVARWKAALAAYGVTPDRDPPAEAAGRVNGSVVRDRLLAALDTWLAVEPSAGVRAVLRAADPDPYREAVRDAIDPVDRTRVADLSARPEALTQPARFAVVLGRLAGVAANRRRAVPESALQSRPGDLALLMALGTSYQTERESERREVAGERVRWFQAAVAAHPGHTAALNNLGLALLDQGKPDEAIPYLREAIRIDPSFAFAHANLGNALRQKGDPDGAVASLLEAIRYIPESAHNHRELGHALRDKGDPDGAIAAFKEAIRLDPKYARPHVSLGALLADVKRDQAGAIAAFKEAIRIDPGYVAAHCNLGNVFRTTGEADDAIAAYKAAIRIDPTHAPAHNGLGAVLHHAKQDYAGAITSLKEAVRLDPEYVQAHYNLGNALRQKGDPDGALVSLCEAIWLDSEYAPAYRELGNALRAKGDVDGALMFLGEAIRLDPEDFYAHLSLGAILCDVKRDYAGAIAAFKEAIRIDPTRATAHHNLGHALRATGDAVGAAAAYREAVRLNPKYASAHNYLAWLLAAGPDRLRDGKLAVEHGTRACALTGWKQPDYLGTLAAAYAEAGDFDKAIEFQKKALDFPAYAKRAGKYGDEWLRLYARKKPYRDPNLADREPAPAPRKEKP